MFPIFHIAIPLVLFEVPQIKQKMKVNRFSLIIGALLPDIVDKSWLLLGLSSGRGFSHTLIFLMASFLGLFAITKGNKPVSYSFLIGTLSHILLDLPYVPLFYPFVLYEFPILEDPIPYWLNVLFTNPIVFITEIIGIGILLFIVVNNRLFSIKEIINYLKTNPQNRINKSNN